MPGYFKEMMVLDAVCRGCNKKFSDSHCEPKECLLLEEIKRLPVDNVVPSSKDKTDVAPRAEVAKGIFAEISEIVTAIYNKHIFKSDLEDEEKEAVMDFEVDISYAFDELEKKYTEENK